MAKMKPRQNEHGMNSSVDADVSAIVDSVLADPARAEDAKALLTRKLAAPDLVRVAVPKVAPRQMRAMDEADDDMWDNVPV